MSVCVPRESACAQVPAHGRVCVCVRECLHSCMCIGVCMRVCLRERACAQVHAHRHVRVCERAHSQVHAHRPVCECLRERQSENMLTYLHMGMHVSAVGNVWSGACTWACVCMKERAQVR